MTVIAVLLPAMGAALPASADDTTDCGINHSAAACQRLADHGDALSEFNPGMMYDSGTGVRHDEIEAARWMRKTANQGFPPAQFAVAVLIAIGIAVPKDLVQAYMWLTLAASQMPQLEDDRQKVASSEPPLARVN
jgi:TPR repeat protein